MSTGGKGSAPRPFAIDADTFASNWDRIFARAPLPGCTSGTCRDYGECPHTTPCDRLDEYRAGLDDLRDEEDDE